MILHNQTKNHLRWKINMTMYTCEPWGSVDVPDMFVLHCKTRGLPLDVSPVAPEVRAEQNMSDATDKARNDELIKLRHELGLAKAAESAAKAELEKERDVLSGEKSRALKLEVSLAEQRRQVESLTADKAAADELMTETAKKLTDAEQRAGRAEALAAELKRNAPKSESKSHQR